jgi:hypothetical protein
MVVIFWFSFFYAMNSKKLRNISIRHEQCLYQISYEHQYDITHVWMQVIGPLVASLHHRKTLMQDLDIVLSEEEWGQVQKTFIQGSIICDVVVTDISKIILPQASRQTNTSKAIHDYKCSVQKTLNQCAQVVMPSYIVSKKKWDDMNRIFKEFAKQKRGPSMPSLPSSSTIFKKIQDLQRSGQYSMNDPRHVITCVKGQVSSVGTQRFPADRVITLTKIKLNETCPEDVMLHFNFQFEKSFFNRVGFHPCCSLVGLLCVCVCFSGVER